MARNPCVIPGAAQESSPARPAVSVAEVYALADAVDPRWRALVLLAAFCGLRFGELAALRHAGVDLLHSTVTVAASVAELPGGIRHIGPPKSDAGRRTIAIPDVIVPDLEDHLARYAGQGREGLVFVGPKGRAASRRQLRTPGVAPGRVFHRPRGAALPRSARLRRHAGGTLGRDDSGAARAVGSPAGRRGDALPAGDGGPGRSAGSSAVRACHRRDRRTALADSRAHTVGGCSDALVARIWHAADHRIPCEARDGFPTCTNVMTPVMLTISFPS